MTSDDDVLVRCENVGKKFSRDLKQSLWYGINDIVSDFFDRDKRESETQRPLRRGEFWANRDISFELKRGQCLGLIGRNGAGKTTLLKMLNGLIKPDAGRIELHGKTNALIALGAGFNPILTGHENIYINGSILGLSRRQIKDRLDEIVDFAELKEFLDSPIRNYSSGMQVRLGFAIAAVLVKPDILLLDEVLAVGDASFQVKCVNVIRRLQRSGVSICLVSHNLQNILRYCDQGLYLSGGEVKSYGAIREVSQHYQLDAGTIRSRLETSGNVKIDSALSLGKINLRSLDHNDSNIVSSTEPFILEVPYSVEKHWADTTVVIEFLLTDAYGIYHQSFSPPLEIRNSDSCGLFCVEIKALHAATSTMTCDIAVWNLERDNILAWSTGNDITVHSEPTAGRTILETKWTAIKSLQPERTFPP